LTLLNKRGCLMASRNERAPWERPRGSADVEPLVRPRQADDLADKFLESHDAGHERGAVADYGHYFLGSIIISDKDGQKFIIDGQQRLTTLTLLLIFLHHQLADAERGPWDIQLRWSDIRVWEAYGKQRHGELGRRGAA
jgi:Protein of unknown function DUF262